MIVGLDRAIKPVWIQEALTMAEEGMTISELKERVMNSLVEVAGKEAKSKIYTVIARYFIDSEKDKGKSKVVNNPLIVLAKKHTLEEMSPIYLGMLIIRSESVRYVTETLYNRFRNSVFEKKDLREVVYGRYGYRYVSMKFIWAYLNTFQSFKVLEILSKDKIAFKFPINLEDFQKVVILGLHMKYSHVNPITIDEFLSQKHMEIFEWGDLSRLLKRDWTEYGINGVIRTREMFVYLDNAWWK